MLARSLQLRSLSFSVVPTAARASESLSRLFSTTTTAGPATPSTPRPGISLHPNTGNALVDKVLSPQIQDQKTRTKLAIHAAIEKFQKHPGDMGSTAVQIMILTEKLLNLTRHFLYHHKDKGSTRGHQILVARRRKLFAYLKRTDVETYKELALTVALVANDVDVALSFTAAAKKKEERDARRAAA